MNHIHAASMFNRLRAVASSDAMHDALDREILTFSAHMDDKTQADEFMSRVIMGPLPIDYASIRDAILGGLESAPHLSYNNILELVADALPDGGIPHVNLGVGDVIRLMISECVIRRTVHGLYVKVRA